MPSPSWPPTCLPVSPPVAASRRERHRAFIDAQLRLGRNATAIYQDLVDLYGFDGAYNSVKRLVDQLHLKKPEQSDRFSFAPGEEGMVRTWHNSLRTRYVQVTSDASTSFSSNGSAR